MSLGLKGYLKEYKIQYKNCGLKCKIENIFRVICYAWQRAWLGYDYRELLDYSSMFRIRTIDIFKRFKKDHVILFNTPEEYRDSFNSLFLTSEQTDMVLDTMIYHLQMMDEDYVEKVLYGKNIYDDDYDFDCRTLGDHKRICNVMNQNKNAFMKLFNLFFWDLWD